MEDTPNTNKYYVSLDTNILDLHPFCIKHTLEFTKFTLFVILFFTPRWRVTTLEELFPVVNFFFAELPIARIKFGGFIR